MILTVSLAKLFKLFFIFFILCFYSCGVLSNDIDHYLSNSKYFYRNIDIDQDGLMDKVVSNNKNNGDSLLFFRNQGDEKYSLVLASTNFSEDGGNQIDDIKPINSGKYVLMITTVFPRKDNQKHQYFISYENKKWFLSKLIQEIDDFVEDYTKKYICEFNNLKIELTNQDVLSELPEITSNNLTKYCKVKFYMENNLSSFLDRFDSENLATVSGVERYKQLLEKFPYSNKTEKQYNMIIAHLLKLNLNAEVNYLNSIVKETTKYSRINTKTYLYKRPDLKTNMYLIQGDKVKVLNELIDDSNEKWYFINYQGKQEINMWIKAKNID